MLKSVLVLLDETPSSASARKFALRLAQNTGAALAGLAGIDLTFIEAPMLGGIGTSSIKVRLEEKLKKQADGARQRLHEVFEIECRAHNLPFEWFSFEGDPMEVLDLATETRDLVITGHDTAFHGNVHEPLSEILANLLLKTPRPVIICADSLSIPENLLIAYDGSVPARRAVQMFALLGIGQGKRIQVISIDASQELATRRTAAAATYLRSHGYVVDANPISSRDHPEKVLNIEIADQKIGMLVIGAYGRRGFREFLFGSTMSALIEKPPRNLCLSLVVMKYC